MEVIKQRIKVEHQRRQRSRKIQRKGSSDQEKEGKYCGALLKKGRLYQEEAIFEAS